MDTASSFGFVRVIKRDKETGEITFDQLFKNQITNYARTKMAAMWAGQVVNVPSMISVGTGSGTISALDTSLWTELSGSRKSVDYATVWLDYYTQYSVTYQQTEAIGTVDPVTNPNGLVTLTEAGLWDAFGNLWSHVSLTGVTHDNTQTLSIQWQILHQGN